VSNSPQPEPSFVCEDAEPFEIEQVYRAHRRWLIGFLRRRFGRRQAEDLAQEAFVRLVCARVRIRNPRALLARVAVNAARDQARRRAVRREFSAVEAATQPLAAAAAQAEAVLLKQVVLALPPKLQEVFVLSRFGGLTYEEIARRCGIAVKTVESRMTRALAICSAMMD
jgi:RNA polymerase sigma-70 factor (ECF subfamily)